MASLIKIDNLVRIDKIIGFEKPNLVSSEYLLASIVPATVSAAGFDIEEISLDRYSMIDWFLTLKLANVSKEDIAIEEISAEWAGKNNYRCSSIYTQIYESTASTEAEIIKQFIDKKSNGQVIFLPFIIKKGEEKIIRVDFLLRTFKRFFLHYRRKTSFKKEEIKIPATYQQLLQKAIIKIKSSKNSLMLKI